MIFSDCHMHTEFSSDSDSHMEDMVLKAISLGLKTITFTEHMDLEFPADYDMPFVFDEDCYEESISLLRLKYKDKIQILKGIEIGLKPHLSEKYNTLLSLHSYDFVIGSTHLVDDIDPYYNTYWVGYEEKIQIIRYFEYVLKNIISIDNYDSLGHLDYILRYSPSKDAFLYYKEYKDIVEQILKHIINKEKALEINTSGYKSGLMQPNPSYDIIKLYKELNGRLITIGSDAHSPEHIAYAYKKLYGLLSDVGIHEYYIYKNRTPYFVELD